MSIKKHLNFDSLRQAFSDLLYQTDDPRQKTKVGYKLPLQAKEGRRPRPVVPGSLRAGCFSAGKI